MPSKNLTPIEHLHPTTVEKIKSNNRIFEQHFRERLYHKDYAGLKALMKIKVEGDNFQYMDTDIINDILQDKDYTALKIIIKAVLENPKNVQEHITSEHSIFVYIVKKATKQLNLEVLTFILDETLHSKLDVSSLNLFKHLEGRGSLLSLINRHYHKKDPAQYKMLVKAFVAAIHKQKQEQLNGDHLKELSYYITKQEFDKFIEDQKINITKFDVTFKHYDLESGGAIIAKSHAPSLIEDIVLQRTYSNSSNIDAIKKAYNELFSSKSPFIKDAMSILALNILKGDDVRIFFSEGASMTSSYNDRTNTIKVGIKGKDYCISIASAAIHEIGHYVFHKLYAANAAPFNFDSLQSNHSDEVLNRLGRSTDSDNIYDGIRSAFNITGYNKISLKDAVTNFYFSCSRRNKGVHDINKLDQIYNKLQDYEFGPRNFLISALNLLQIENAYTELDKHLTSQNLVEWIKGNAPVLDLFSLHSHYRYETNSSNHTESVYINMQNIYAQGIGFDICPTNTNITNFHNRPLSYAIKDMKDYSFTPIVKHYGLSLDQVCFLERTADFVNRHNSKFDDTSCHCQDDLTLYAELIVRCPEFQALKLDQNIIDSACKDVFTYWEQYISPDVKAHIANYKADCLDYMDSHDRSCKAELAGDCNLRQKHCEIFLNWVAGE